MTAIETDAQDWPPDAVRRQLATVLESEPFRQAARQKRFLSYLVEEELAGRGERLSQYAIACDVFDRESGFDPAVDSVVRVEARRLRTKLAEYYAALPASDPLVIALPKGRYRVRFSAAAAGREPRRSADPEAKPTVAVLPFDNLGGDPAQDYFSDGITEDIITDLSKLSGLSVISRHSTFVYKGRSVAARDIGDDLGARFLVEGSVRRAGDRVRVTAQLIDAQRDSHLWAERYDRELGEVFAIQDEVTRLIVEALNVTLTEVEGRRLGHRGTESRAAHDLLLRAMQRFYAFGHDDVAEAIARLQDALAFDPGYAEARAWLGRVLVYAAIAGLVEDDPDPVGSAVAQAREAIAADPLLPPGHAVLGWALTWAGAGEEALVETARALELDPSFADGYLWRAMALCAVGEGQEALTAVERGMRLNPHFGVTYLHALALAHFALAQYEEVLLQCRHSRRRNANFLPSHLLEITTLAQLGRTEALSDRVGEARRLDPKGSSILPGFFIDAELKARYNKGLETAGLKVG